MSTKSVTLSFRRNHPGGGPLGRCSYGVAGVPGIVVFDLGLFPGGVAPATITLDCELAQPSARKVAGVTSAVVAGANLEAAKATQQPIAAPAEVAAVAAVVSSEVVAAAKNAAAAVLAGSPKLRKASKGHAAKVG